MTTVKRVELSGEAEAGGNCTENDGGTLQLARS